MAGLPIPTSTQNNGQRRQHGTKAAAVDHATDSRPAYAAFLEAHVAPAAEVRHRVHVDGHRVAAHAHVPADARQTVLVADGPGGPEVPSFDRTQTFFL